MSHFSKIQTSLKDLDLLKKSLNDLSIYWEPELNQVRGYKDQTTLKFYVMHHIVIQIRLGANE